MKAYSILTDEASSFFFLWIIGLYTAGKGLLVMYYLQASAYFHTIDFNLVWLFRRMTILLVVLTLNESHTIYYLMAVVTCKAIPVSE